MEENGPFRASLPVSYTHLDVYKRQGLLHFKYLNDFSENVKIEVKREAHWRNAAEYKEYSKTFNCCPSLNLHSSSSRKFTGSDQLITLDIMKTSQKFDEFGCQLIDL